MKNLKECGAWFMVGLIFAGTVVFLSLKNSKKVADVPSVQTEKVLSQELLPKDSEWKVLDNKKYRYILSYPNSVRGGVDSMEDIPIEEGAMVGFYTEASSVHFVFSVEALKERMSWGVAGDANDIFFLDLKSFAKEMRRNQVEYKNPNISDKYVGEMREISVDGQKGYSFMLTKAFAWGRNSEGYDTGGYMFLDDSTRTYIFVENKQGEKYIISYITGNVIAEKMLESFKFK